MFFAPSLDENVEGVSDRFEHPFPTILCPDPIMLAQSHDIIDLSVSIMLDVNPIAIMQLRQILWMLTSVMKTLTSWTQEIS